MNAYLYIKLGDIRSASSQDIEWKRNSDANQEL